MPEPKVHDAWHEADAYERYMGRWSRQLAPLFVSWLGASPGRRWLDVGCGTGALCAAIVEHGRPATVTGVEPAPRFLAMARQHLPSSVHLASGSAESIPVQPGQADVVVSGLVLNFLPDVSRGLAEMKRVAASGGVVAAYVWDYDEGMEMLRMFWDAAVRLDPDVAKLQERLRFNLCRPESLRDAFDAGGFGSVEVAALDMQMPFASFDDYWLPFLGATGPAPAYVASLPEDRRLRLREALRASLPRRADDSFVLRARAWAVRGRA